MILRQLGATLLGLGVGCSTLSGSAESPPTQPEVSTAAPGQPSAHLKSAANAASGYRIAQDGKVGLTNHIANCLRVDATVLIDERGEHRLEVSFLSKQAVGYCGCKSARVSYVIKRGGARDSTAASSELAREGNSMLANGEPVDVIEQIRVGHAVGLEVLCKG